MKRHALLSTFMLLFLAPLVSAHGLGIRIDLPIPLRLYVLGGGLTVALSFLVIALVARKPRSIRYPKYDLLRLGFFRFFTRPVVKHTIKGLFVLLLVFFVLAGLIGSQRETDNITPTMVWIYFTIILPIFTALVGNIWQYINPWKTLFEWFSKKDVKRSVYPSLWQYWPAVVLYFVFRWIENAYSRPAHPLSLAVFIIIYSAITWYGMKRYGKDTWLKYADPFSVLYDLLARFSITEVVKEDGKTRLNLRPPFVGLELKEKISSSMTMFILLMMATITYDGLKATEWWIEQLSKVFLLGIPGWMVHTLGYVGVFAAFSALYYVFCYFIKKAGKSEVRVGNVANTFAISLLPIAIAYEISHYITLILTEGQRIVALASDPFGYGWNLLGTAAYKVNYAFIDFILIWNIEVTLIVVGHIVAVFLAHVLAFRVFKKHVVRSQYPMMILMILYTMSSLWILAQPLVAGH